MKNLNRFLARKSPFQNSIEDNTALLDERVQSELPETSLFRSTFRHKMATLGLLTMSCLTGVGCKGCQDHSSKAEQASFEVNTDNSKDLEHLRLLMPKANLLEQQPSVLKPESLRYLNDGEFIKVAKKFSEQAKTLFENKLAGLLEGENVIEAPEKKRAIEDFLMEVFKIAQNTPELKAYAGQIEQKKVYYKLMKKLKPLFLAGGYYFSIETDSSTHTVNVGGPTLDFFLFEIKKAQAIELADQEIANTVSAYILSRKTEPGKAKIFGSYDGDIQGVCVIDKDIADVTKITIEDAVFKNLLTPLLVDEELIKATERDRFIHTATVDFLKKKFPIPTDMQISVPVKMTIPIAPEVSKGFEGVFTLDQFYNLGAMAVELYHSQAKIPVALINCLKGEDNDNFSAFTREILPAYILKAAPPSQQKDDLLMRIRNAQKEDNSKASIKSVTFAKLYLETFTEENKEILALRMYQEAIKMLSVVQESLKKNDSDKEDTPSNNKPTPI